jgi:hypothetical protein
VRHRWFVFGGLLLACAGPVTAQVAVDSNPFDRAMARYSRNRLKEALPLFLQAAQDSPADVERQNWLAETQRRIGSLDEAVRTARGAATLAGCSSFTYAILGAAFSPQYSTWEQANYDSTWSYLHRAVACDPSDGNAWLLMWGEALRRGETPLVERALRSLVRSGFLTAPNMELARWVLRTLPPRAILLTAGDMDTYPALAAQVMEHVRPDVVVVNEPMLDLPWYALQFGRAGLVLPVPEDSLAADARRGTVTGDLKDSVLALWRRMAAAGTLHRPLLFALSTGEPGPSERREAGRLRLIGAARMVVPDSDSAAVDTAAARHALSLLEATRWRGAALSPQDRSAVRRAAQVPPALYVVYLSAQYGLELLKARRVADARRVLANAQAFGAAVTLDPAILDGLLSDLRAELALAEKH